MHVAIERVHTLLWLWEWNACNDWVWLKMCGEHSRKWYLCSQTRLGKKVHIQLVSSLVPKCLISHLSKCELNSMEPIVLMADNKMSSNMYWYMWFPLFRREYDFVVRCIVCSIMCEVWTSTFFPSHDTLVLQEGLVRKGIYCCIMKQEYHPIFQTFFSKLSSNRNTIIVFMCLLDHFAQSWCEEVFLNLTHTISRSMRVYEVCFFT